MSAKSPGPTYLLIITYIRPRHYLILNFNLVYYLTTWLRLSPISISGGDNTLSSMIARCLPGRGPNDATACGYLPYYGIRGRS